MSTAQKQHAQRDEDAQLSEATRAAEAERQKADPRRESNPENSRCTVADGIRDRGLAAHPRVPRLVKPLAKKQAEIIAEAEKDRAKTDGNNIQSLKGQRADSHGCHGGKREQQCNADQAEANGGSRPKTERSRRRARQARSRRYRVACSARFPQRMRTAP